MNRFARQRLSQGVQSASWRYIALGVVALLIMTTFLVPRGFAQDEDPIAPSVFDAAEPGGTLPGDPQIELVQVATGLIDPINVTHAGDGSGRLFIVERVGTVRIVQDGQ